LSIKLPREKDVVFWNLKDVIVSTKGQKKKEVIVGQLIKDINKGQTGKSRRSSWDSSYSRVVAKPSKAKGGKFCQQNCPERKTSSFGISRTSSYPPKARKRRKSSLDNSSRTSTKARPEKVGGHRGTPHIVAS
jgi:hypothetical protein